MSAPVKLNLKIYQGSTFREVLRWEQATKVYKPISGIAKSAPIQITATEHGIPNGWRVLVTNVSGMKEINSADTYRTATVVSSDVIELNAINAVGFTDYVSGGIIEYNQPVDLTGTTGRMQIRSTLASETFILELTTENGGIIIDASSQTITIYIDAVTTAGLDFQTAVYSLELIKSGDVIPFVTGGVSLVKEVTR